MCGAWVLYELSRVQKAVSLHTTLSARPTKVRTINLYSDAAYRGNSVSG